MIKLENVCFKYGKGKQTLSDINLELKQGQFISVIGKNGSSKSTLARLIAGILKPTKGSVVIEGLDTKKKENFIDIRKQVGIVFQNPENQIIFNSVKDEMSFALDNLKLDHKEERIKEALKQVGLEEKINEEAYNLSLGQKQRLTIASVLAMKTKYIVLDEPTAMLDPIGKQEIYDIIADLKKEGYTIIYVTNVIDEILLSDQVLILEDGKIKDYFAKEDLINHIESIKQSGIKIPEIIELWQGLQEQGIELELKEWTMKELVEKLAKEYNK